MSDFEHVETWLNWKKNNQNRSHGTVIKYRRNLKKLQEYLQQLDSPVDLLKADIDMLLDFTGLHAHKNGLTPRTRQSLVSSVRGFYKWALKKGLVRADLFTDLEQPKVGKKLPDVATLSTAEKLIMAPDINTLIGIRDCAIFSVLIGGGLRIAEIRMLNESNLIWDRIDNKPRLIIKVLGKGDKQRLVPMSNDGYLLMRAYLGHPELPLIDRSLPSADQVLFISLNNHMIPEHEYIGENRRLSRKSIDDRIKKYGRELSLPEKHLHAHAFRHLYGTQLAEDNHSTRRIQDLLGHEDPKTTEIYTKLALRGLADAVDQSSPLTKVNTPVSGLHDILEK